LSHFGGSRVQCDWVGTRFRDVVGTLIGLRFGKDSSFRVSTCKWRALGGVERSDQVDPPMWSATDTFTLLCDA